jgi:hypothetical protein
MSYLGDTLTVSLILVLLFGSIALYLYTRVQQTEQKVSLLESIVLDLKLTGELQPFHGLPEHIHDIASSPPASATSVAPVASLSPTSASSSSNEPSNEEYVPFVDAEEVEELEAVEVVEAVEEVKGEESTLDFLPLDAPAPSLSLAPVSPYETMSLKELQSLARSRSLTVEKGAKKHILVELLKKQDAEQNEVKPGSTSSPIMLESFSQDE